MFTHKHKETVVTDLGTKNSVEEVITADAEVPLDAVIPAASTDFRVDVFMIRAQLKSVWLQCDKAVTIKTNSSGAPQETITLAAGIPKRWKSSSQLIGELMFSGDITAFFVTNAGAQALLTLRALQDATPSTP